MHAPAAAVTIGVFAHQLAVGTESTPGLALLQKLTILSALAWFGATAARPLRARETARAPGP